MTQSRPATGDVPSSVFDAVTARYHRHLGQLARAGMARRAAAGYLPGNAPLGYDNVTRNGRKSIVVNPQTGPRIQALFLRAAENQSSISQLLEYAKTIKMVSCHGKPLGKSSLWKILRNHFYCGYLQYQGKRHKGKHPALISEATYQQVQENLRGRRKCTNENNAP